MDNPKLLVTCEHSCSEHAYCGKLVSQITLLDLFAAFSLAGLQSLPDSEAPSGSDEIAKVAYRDAEAMLKERENVIGDKK